MSRRVLVLNLVAIAAVLAVSWMGVPLMLAFQRLDLAAQWIWPGETSVDVRSIRFWLVIYGGIGGCMLLSVWRRDKDRYALGAGLVCLLLMVALPLFMPSTAADSDTDGYGYAPPAPMVDIEHTGMPMSWNSYFWRMRPMLDRAMLSLSRKDMAGYERQWREAYALYRAQPWDSGGNPARRLLSRFEELLQESDPELCTSTTGMDLQVEMDRIAISMSNDDSKDLQPLVALGWLQYRLHRLCRESAEVSTRNGNGPDEATMSRLGLARRLLDESREGFHRVLTGDIERVDAWFGLAMTYLEDDPERALGAFSVGERIASKYVGSDDVLQGTVRINNVFDQAHRKAYARRAEILFARARQLNATENLRGTTARTSQLRTPQDFTTLANLVLPPGEPLPGLYTPSIGATDGYRSGEVDFDAIGVMPDHRVRPLFSPDLVGSRTIDMVVSLDVLNDGSLTGVFVERSTGKPGLDQAAVDAAGQWKFWPRREDDGKPGYRLFVPVKLPDATGAQIFARIRGGSNEGAAMSPADAPASVNLQSRQQHPPIYPPAAKSAGIEGQVILAVDLDAMGNVTSIQVSKSSGSKLLDGAAVVSARQWTYTPRVENGEPMASRLQVPVDYGR